MNDDATHRLVTDTEKATWDAKSDFSGSYNDLTDKPEIPDELADLSDDATHRLVTDTEKAAWDAKSDFSGSYNDLTDKPNIPDELNDLSDVAVNNVQNGQILKYNSTTQKFENANESGGTITDAFVNAQVGSDVIAASGADTLKFIAGSNVNLDADTTNKTITISTAAGGDMLKSVYDANDDGVVDEATTLTGLTASVGELNALDGITSNVQGQLNNKANAGDIPTDLADLNDDATHRLVTDTEKSMWDNKSNFSGSYDDLTDKPTLGTAAAKDSTSSVTSGSTDLIESGAVYDALDNTIQKSSTAGLVKNDGSIDTNSYATTSQLSSKVDTSSVGQANGVASLGSDGKIPTSQLPEIPSAQVQADYAQTDTTAVDYIKNKPTLGTAAAKDSTSTLVSGSTDLIESGTVKDALDNKVDVVAGKGLSTEDYTTAEKAKLEALTLVTVDTVNHALVINTYADGNNISY